MTYSGDITPPMTAASTPSGYTASASGEYSATYAAWKAFHNKVEDGVGWICGSGSPNVGWLQLQFPSGVTVTRYAITAVIHAAPRCFRSWTLKGSNNGTDWTTLDTRTHGVWTSGQTETYDVSNSTSYTYYRLDGNNSGVSEDYLIVGQVQFMSSFDEPASYTTDIVPTMTAANAPSGVASASSEYDSSCAAWKALNDSSASGDGWITGTVSTGWIKYALSSAKTVRKYTVTSLNHATPRPPRCWTLEGSTDDSTWAILDNRYNVSDWVSSGNVQKSFAIPNTTAYSYYRLNIIQVSSGATSIALGEWELLEAASFVPGRRGIGRGIGEGIFRAVRRRSGILVPDLPRLWVPQGA